MATYIALKDPVLYQLNTTATELYYVVNQNSIVSYPLTLTSGTPWSINNSYYWVYLVGNSSSSYNINSSWFVHLYNDSNNIFPEVKEYE